MNMEVFVTGTWAENWLFPVGYGSAREMVSAVLTAINVCFIL